MRGKGRVDEERTKEMEGEEGQRKREKKRGVGGTKTYQRERKRKRKRTNLADLQSISSRLQHGQLGGAGGQT
jgi:hypothetical protein